MNRELIDKKLGSLIKENIINRKWGKDIMSKMDAIHDVSPRYVSNYLTMAEGIENADNDIAATLLTACVDKKDWSKYLSANEIKKYEKWKLQTEKLGKTIKFRVVQVAPDQWIGTTSVKQLMLLRKAQMIKYDPNAQRPLERKVIHGTEVYGISLNNRAVDAIKDAYHNEIYIPNTITLNIPVDVDLGENERPAVFSYYDDIAELEIKHTPYLAITDGYHRFVAMTREQNENEEFDYPMCIMLTNFPLNKEQQYIYQEDQKTQMSKVASNSMNQNNAATQIIERMNNNTAFCLHGLIKRNQGIISSPVLNALINALYQTSSLSRSKIIEIEKEIEENFEKLIAQDATLLDKKWDWRFLTSAMVCFSKGNTDLKYVNKLYDEVHSNVSLTDPDQLSKWMVNRFTKTYDLLDGKAVK